MNGYYKIRIMDHNGTWFDCWQKVDGGMVVGYFESDGVTPIELPKAHDAFVLEKNLLAAPPLMAEALKAAEKQRKADELAAIETEAHERAVAARAAQLTGE